MMTATFLDATPASAWSCAASARMAVAVLNESESAEAISADLGQMMATFSSVRRYRPPETESASASQLLSLCNGGSRGSVCCTAAKKLALSRIVARQHKHAPAVGLEHAAGV